MPNEQPVPALVRAYALMAGLLASPLPLGISDLARTLGLGKSTVHGLAHTLVHLGLLETSGEKRPRFKPAGPVLDLWNKALLTGTLARSAREGMADLSRRHSLTTLAGFYLPGGVLIVEAVLAQGVSVAAYPGLILPTWAGALGKIVLATLPPERARTWAVPFAARSSMNLETYLAEVEQVRLGGVAWDREEYIRGVRALGVAVPYGGPGQPLAAVCILGLASALDDDRLTALGPELLALAQNLAQNLVASGQEDGFEARVRSRS